MRLTLLGLVLFTLPAAAGQVHVVGPGQLATIQDAITLAADGDVIIVKSGGYATVRITNKQIAVVAENGANVNVSGAVRVTDLASSRSVVLAGLTATGTVSPTLPELGVGLLGRSCAGSIVVQDCTFRGGSITNAPCTTVPACNGVELQACNGVSLVRCTAAGGFVYMAPLATQQQQGSGVRASGQSRLSLDACLAQGGGGGWVCNGYLDGAVGGDGLQLDAANVFTSGSTFTGGHGSQPGGTVMFALSGNGGNGTSGAGSTNTITSLATLFQAGLGGGYYLYCGFCPSCCAGDTGYPIVGNVTMQYLTGTASALNGPRLVRDNETPEFRVDAAPGDRVEIAVARAPTYQTDVASGCILHVKDPNWIVAGVVPPGGNNVKRRYHMPDLSVTTPGQIFYVQARVTSATAVQRLTNVQAVVLVDSSY